MVLRGRYTGPSTKIKNLNWIQWDLTPSLPPTTPAEGLMYWNVDDGTLNLGMPGGNVNLQLGQEMLIRSRNDSGSDMTNGQLVYISGASGNRPQLTLAKADTEIDSSATIGMLTEDIDDNGNGYVNTFGFVRGIKTDVDADSTALSEGDVLWLSENVAGGFTKTKPVSPDHLVFVGYVMRAHATEGEIFIKVQNGFEIDELHDITIASKVHGDVLTYNNDTTIWENHTLTHVGTDAPTSPSTQVVGRIWLDTDAVPLDKSTFGLRSVSTSQTLLTTDMIILASSTITLTLPVNATTAVGKTIYIKNKSTGAVTVAGTIDGDTNIVLIQDESIRVVNDLTEWWVI